MAREIETEKGEMEQWGKNGARASGKAADGMRGKEGVRGEWEMK